MDDEVLTYREVAKRLGCSCSTVYYWMTRGLHLNGARRVLPSHFDRRYGHDLRVVRWSDVLEYERSVVAARAKSGTKRGDDHADMPLTEVSVRAGLNRALLHRWARQGALIDGERRMLRCRRGVGLKYLTTVFEALDFANRVEESGYRSEQKTRAIAVPTQDEIAERAAEIRAEWPEHRLSDGHHPWEAREYKSRLRK